MELGKVELITQADWVLSKCGRPQIPVGSVVYIYRGFQIQLVDPVGAGQTFYKEITGDTNWCWRTISGALSGAPPAVFGQVTSPNGKVLFNGLLDLTAIAGYGSNRYALSNEIVCPPGSKIQLTCDDSYPLAAAVQPVSMLLGGAYAYYLKDGLPGADDAELRASQLPRVFATTDQNVFAPAWMQGVYPTASREGEPYTHGDGVSNLATFTIGGVTSGKVSIQIDNERDFDVYRFLFDVIPDGTVTAGVFLCRIRAGSGYVFTDDYVDGPRYLGSACLLKPWRIRKGDSIVVDLILASGAGSGDISIQIQADGIRRFA